MFQRTTAINKILKLNKFVRAVQGGTSAGKTYGIIPILVDMAAKRHQVDISIVAESIPHLKRGAMKDFKKIMTDTGRWNWDRWNATDFRYTFANGSTIEFFSADNNSKLRGARRDYLYINECNNVDFQSYNELASRTKSAVYLDWNPTNEFWFHQELQQDADVDFIIINYLDNEACPESARNFIEKAKQKSATSAYWLNWWKVYGLGELGTLQGAIFENYKIIDTIPSTAMIECIGLDFGYTNDPTAAVAVYKHDGKFILNELIYAKGQMNKDISDVLKNYRCLVVADSAEPKSIDEIRLHGINIKAAEKGKDSINFGIQLIQGVELLITAQSTNLIKEIRGYMWEKDRAGKELDLPIGVNNHAMDAMRYAMTKILHNKYSGKYSIL